MHQDFQPNINDVTKIAENKLRDYVDRENDDDAKNDDDNTKNACVPNLDLWLKIDNYDRAPNQDMSLGL